MPNELELCPFCDSNAGYSQYKDGFHSIGCEKCGAEISAETKEEAEAKWNARPTVFRLRVENEIAENSKKTLQKHLDKLGSFIDVTLPPEFRKEGQYWVDTAIEVMCKLLNERSTFKNG